MAKVGLLFAGFVGGLVVAATIGMWIVFPWVWGEAHSKTTDELVSYCVTPSGPDWEIIDAPTGLAADYLKQTITDRLDNGPKFEFEEAWFSSDKNQLLFCRVSGTKESFRIAETWLFDYVQNELSVEFSRYQPISN